MLLQAKPFTFRYFCVLLLLAGFFVFGSPSVNVVAQESAQEQGALRESEDGSVVGTPSTSYLFVHDTSKNMRKKKRISLIQNTIRKILNELPDNALVGLQAFGHRFSLDGPDACDDTEMIVPFGPLKINRQDFETQFNLLVNPTLGGGAPVGFSLQQGLETMGSFAGRKEIFFYMVDLKRCAEPDPLEAIASVCQRENTHLTLIGIGLKQDMKTLQQADIERLGCVDVINLISPEDAETLPDKLLTRLSVEFRNAEGAQVDPAPGEELLLRLYRPKEAGEVELLREKVKDATMKGVSIETVGLEEGAYLLELVYQGQPLREKKEIVLTNREQTTEVLRLGRMRVDVTDSLGNVLEAPDERDVRITVTDAGKAVRTVQGVAHAEFDLLPGMLYDVHISYNVGGIRQEINTPAPITIREGNHQDIRVALTLGAVQGKVFNMKGNPSDHVKMTLVPMDPKAAEQTTFTDENGNYFFSDVHNGTYSLEFEKDAYKRDYHEISVVGGRINVIEDIALFHGIEISVVGVSGAALEQAEVTLTHSASQTNIPVTHYHTLYRNTIDIEPGLYEIAVKKDGYQTSSQTVELTPQTTAQTVSFALPYYVSVSAAIVNGKGEALSGAQLSFLHQQTSLVDPAPPVEVQTGADGTFNATLQIAGDGDEEVEISWNDRYNQSYAKTVRFRLPTEPRHVDLGRIRLPVNFLRLSLNDLPGNALSADTLELSHKQSGQSGIRLNRIKPGFYESAALLDGDYTILVMKKGYQEVEQNISIRDGHVKEIPLVLNNYISVTGTVVDGKNNRLADAQVIFAETSSRISSLQPVMTGKDGRFQATLLVRDAKTEAFTVQWKSPESGKEYRISTTFELPGIPVTEYQPKDLGSFELPSNFVQVAILDVAGHGLPGVKVEFISSRGETTRGKEFGDGLYESLDLQDGSYNITLSKPGYKEHVIISDVAVGKMQRDVQLAPITLPHYAKVTGTILNGKGEGVPNVELAFGGDVSEQLEQCRTDQKGKFFTTLLINGSSRERWRAFWKKDEFQISGDFLPPQHPQAEASLGEIYLPANFLSIPVQDVRGEALSDVAIEVLRQDGTPVDAEEFSLEEIEPGIYQAQNLPDGRYIINVHKEGYETGRSVEIPLQGGSLTVLKPVRLGYYVTILGAVTDGNSAPVSGAEIRFNETHCQLLPPQPTPSDSEETSPLLKPSILTDTHGKFTATLLVTSSGLEPMTTLWQKTYSLVQQLNLSQGPQTQEVQVTLPINFVAVTLADISDHPLTDASVSLTHRVSEAVFRLEESEPGTYFSRELPDGQYDLQLEKDRYETKKAEVGVQRGEVKTMTFRLNHYVSVKGHVVDGKGEGISAATVTFRNFNTESHRQVISGTDGAFETQLLVKEIGKEEGEITWVGNHGTYTKKFLLTLSAKPDQIALPVEKTRLPVNYMTIEVKSVAATGVAGASVVLTHRETEQRIEAHDNGHGNYEGIELPNGAYDVVVTKENYQTVQLENITVADGEHKSSILIPRFFHYITMSGVVLNGKNQGVADAAVSIKTPQRLTDCEPFTTRADGSFTLHALVTDIGTETIDVAWENTYGSTLPVKLPTGPKHIRLEPIKLPINFISLRVQDIYENPLVGASVLFLKKEHQIHIGSPKSTTAETRSHYTAQEVANGIYESPPLPDHTYILVVRKEGYIQNHYPEIFVSSGETISEVLLNIPHLLTVTGKVLNGKDEGVPGVEVNFAQKNSQRNLSFLKTDESGSFAEQLLVTHPGNERVSFSKAEPSDPGNVFQGTHEFTLLTAPGTQALDDFRLPINFIPIRVQNVAQTGIADVDIGITRLESSETMSSSAEDDALKAADAPVAFQLHYLGEGRYEARNLQDGIYRITLRKQGYQQQDQSVTVMSGAVAPEVVFTLPHYVVVKGHVSDGKGDGVSNALLEFDEQNSDLVPLQVGDEAVESSQRQVSSSANGEFIARLLVKETGVQRVHVSWNTHYAKEFFFPLTENPDSNYVLNDRITLPINFAPFHITNVMNQGMAGVEIRVNKVGSKSETPTSLAAHALGEGHYEVQELRDGVYAMAIHKEGYRNITGSFSVQGGQALAEQSFSLPHYVTIRGTVVNSKGVGVEKAGITLAGFNSQSVPGDREFVTDVNGNFHIDLMVTGAGSHDLQEHLEVIWTDRASAEFLPQPVTFGISHDIFLPPTPGTMNLGTLHLPSNFFPVSVQDSTGRGLSGADVTFTDSQGRVFSAKELPGGLYEGQDLPDETYSITVGKDGYQTAYKQAVRMSREEFEQDISANRAPLTFHLPYYVDITGTVVNGKGAALTADVKLTLAEAHSELLPERVSFDGQGRFKAALLVKSAGKESLKVSWKGEYGMHTVSLPFVLPEEPKTLELPRVNLPINFIPIEVKDLLGYGISGATVQLIHRESGQEILAAEIGNGDYEGINLPDGEYQLSVSKEGYKTSQNVFASVMNGIVSDTKTFRLQHYVRITGRATNGEGEGVRDLFIELEHAHSVETAKQSEITGRFALQLEVRDVGTEQMYLTWKNAYRTPVLFNLPGHPGAKDLGEIRLPINFLSFLVTDISGSTLQDVNIAVEDSATGRIQRFKTDVNGFCKTYDLPDGLYHVFVEKAGYQKELRDIQVRNGESLSLRFTLPHYLLVKGCIKDIMQNAVGEAEIVFEEFSDESGQRLRTATDATTGKFEKRLLINDAIFLERQKGHFLVMKDEITQMFTFKIPILPNQTITYNTLLFPTNYLYGTVVDAEIKTIPLDNADIFLTPVPEQPLGMTGVLRLFENKDSEEKTLHLTTNSLGRFEIGHLQQREYKVSIRKEGYLPHEDFIRISGLLQGQEFALRKQQP